MDPETEKIFTDQLKKLPLKVLTFLSSANWDKSADEIGKLYNLSNEELMAFKREITLVLIGLTHPDELGEVLKREVGIEADQLKAMVKNVEDLIFMPIRSSLVAFVKKEDEEETKAEAALTIIEPIKTESVPQVAPAISIQAKAPEVEEFSGMAIPQVINPGVKIIDTKNWEKRADVAPDNLPVAEEIIPLNPPIPSKTPSSETQTPRDTATHPFEEKMKKVFSSGQQSMGDLAIEAPTTQTPAAQAQKPPEIYHSDPYREAIE